MPDLPAGTVTFLFTDIEGSTRLWEEHPEAMREALARHDALLREGVDAAEGRVFKTIGDAFCAVFAAASQAVAAALAVQQALAAEPFGGCALRVRMAVHTGAAEAREGDFFGPSLNRVARLLAIGHGGQVLLSATTQNRLDGALPSGTSLLDLGTHRLRDLAEPERIYQLLHPDLPAAFPALNSLDSLPNNLPQQLSRFIGRQQEMAAVKTLLERNRLTTLVGSGGVGKSRLALQVGADLLDRYPEGVWLVELAPLADPALVPQAVAQALGLREAGGRPLVQVLADYLQPRRLLLLLDNCEHLLSACASLADTLLKSCPHLRLLASSREALGVAGEQSYPVPSLSLPEPGSETADEAVETSEAVHFFVERARLYQPSFTLDRLNAPLVASLCRRLDGIPLAIELAAAWVRSLSVTELNARLESGFRLLTGGSRTALPRQQTLRATIDWSHRLLSPEEQRLLQRLSVFAGGWTLEAAEAVCAGEGIEAWEVLELLTRLVDKSLVPCDPGAGAGRYRLLETVRQYAREKLGEAGEPEGVWQRHRNFYLSLAEQAAPHIDGAHQAAWQQRLEREHDNLRAALEWSLSSEDDAEAALRLVGALGQFWLIGSHLREGTDWVRKALARGRNGSPLVLARAMIGGWYCAYHCDVVLAGLLGEEALRFAREAQDRWTIAIALFAVALQAVGRGEYERARASAEEGMALAQAEGDRWLMGRHLVALGLIAWMRDDYTAARSFFREALEIFRVLADEWDIGMTLALLGSVTRREGDCEATRALHQEGLPLFQRLGDRRGIGWHLVGMAGVEVEQGRAERAARLLGAAATVLEAVGSPLPPFLQREHDHTREQTAAALGEGAFAAAWAEGRALPLEKAITYALEEPSG